MECTVRWTGLSGMTFLAETGSGHVVAMDGAPEGGGRNLAPCLLYTSDAADILLV